MLSQQQLEKRSRGIGASEVPAILGLSPFRGPADVWMSKWRGPDAAEPPLVQRSEPVPGEVAPTDVGNALEPAIVELYRMARPEVEAVEEVGTLAHPEHTWALATPDRIARSNGSRWGLECKAVGFGKAHDWADGLPDYVTAQVQWSMLVAQLERWDVASLVGTDLRIVHVTRDNEAIEMMLALVGAFWREHVLANVPPQPDSAAEAARLVRARYPRAGEDMLDVSGDATIAALVQDLVVAQREEKAAAERARGIKAELCGYVGERKGIAGPWGSYQWPNRKGTPQWKAIAEHLNGGPVSDEVADKFRSEGGRAEVGTLYAKKNGKGAGK